MSGPLLALLDPLPELDLSTADGGVLSLTSFRGHPLVAVCIRYYGCIPCLDYLAQLREAHQAFVQRRARVIAVGTGAVVQARRLTQEGMLFSCLVDETAALHRALGIGRVSWSTVLRATTYGNYWRAWRRGARPGRVTGDPQRLSGVAIFDAAGRLRWIHRSGTIGDYPAVTTVLAELDRLRDDGA